MELSGLDTQKGAEQGFDVVITNPKTGEATEIIISVLGSDSSEYQRASNELARLRLNQASKTRRMTQTPEMLQADAISLLVSATRGWRGIEIDGATLPFNQANAAMLYTRFPWIREQVDQAIHDRANFLPKAANS